MTVMQQNMAIANRPEIGAAAIIADFTEEIAFDKGMQVIPGLQVLGAEEEFGPRAFPAGRMGQDPPGERVVKSILLPEAGVVHEIDRPGRNRIPE